MRVRGVLTRQGRDISDMLNETAGDYADSYTGVLIAESGLNEQAWRQHEWPDISGGLSQVIAANFGGRFGTYQRPATEAELAEYKTFIFKPVNAVIEGWRFYRAALEKHVDPLWAAFAYNVGNSRSTTELMELAQQPEYMRRLEHYRKALKEAERYRIMATTAERLAILEEQQRQQTQALRRILESKLEGADGAAANVVALEGGGTTITVTLPQLCGE